jgi:uncharacterized membrane protein SpoIIM required for sporulation
MPTQDRQEPSETSSDAARTLIRTFILSFGIWALAFVAGIWSTAALTPSGIPLAGHRSPEPRPPDTLRILATNLVVLLISASGLFTFGLTSVITLLVSGLFVGLIVGASYQDGVGLRAILWLTLPHSMELIGLWLANGVGLLGYHHGRRVLETSKRIDCTLLLEALLLGLAITIIAACIEGEFTLKWVIGRYV